MKKETLKELLKRWNDRAKLIQEHAIQLGDTEEETKKRIERSTTDYNYFCRTYFPHLATSDCGDFQIEAAHHVADNKYTRALFEWARGHAKSTHISCLIPLWLIARKQTDFNFMILCSKSYENAVGLLQDIQNELSTNEAYKKDFGVSTEGDEWKTGKFSLSCGITFVAVGRGQSPRGLKKRGRRPDYIIIDDIDDDELVENEARVRKAHKWVLSALFNTMAVGRGRFICVGNRIAKYSILSLIAKMKNIHHTVVNILDEKGNVRWKENYKLEEIQRLKEDIGTINFYREYMNSPTTEGAVFKEEYFRYKTMLPLKQYRRLVVYTDPSWKSTNKNDYKATVLVGKTKTGEYHVLKVFAGQTSVKRMVAWHYEIENFIHGTAPVRYWMEANFVQDLLLAEFQKEGEAKGGKQISITADKRAKPQKYARIEAMQPLFERGEIIFNIEEKDSEGMQVLIEQLLAIEPGSKIHDDAPDALEGAIWLLNYGSTKKKGRFAIAPSIDRRQ